MKKLLIFAFIASVLITSGISGCCKSNLDSFASCVANKSILYVQEGCPHCADQEKMFCSSVSNLNIVDCKYQQDKCIAAGIQYIPAWDINGNKSTGVKSLEEIASLTNCSLP